MRVIKLTIRKDVVDSDKVINEEARVQQGLDQHTMHYACSIINRATPLPEASRTGCVILCTPTAYT